MFNICIMYVYYVYNVHYIIVFLKVISYILSSIDVVHLLWQCWFLSHANLMHYDVIIFQKNAHDDTAFKSFLKTCAYYL